MIITLLISGLLLALHSPTTTVLTTTTSPLKPSQDIQLQNLQFQVEDLSRQEIEINRLLNEINLPKPLETKPPLSQATEPTTPTKLAFAIQTLQTHYLVLADKLHTLKVVVAGIPTIWPAYGPIASGFGYREHPIYGEEMFHKGIDIAAQYGTPIHSTADGVVTYSGWGGSYGYVVIIQHLMGYSTLYGHASELLVDSGTHVSKGQLIGLVGSTGLSTGAHLHYEVRRWNVPIPPNPFLDGDVLRQGSI